MRSTSLSPTWIEKITLNCSMAASGGEERRGMITLVRKVFFFFSCIAVLVRDIVGQQLITLEEAGGGQPQWW